MEQEKARSIESFRISVNLERYFSDERTRVYVSARGDRPVRWLMRRLRRQFALPARTAALCHGHLLPPAEPLALLRPDDTLHLVPVQGDWYDRLAEELISSDEDIENIHEAKRKYSSKYSRNKGRKETYKGLEEVNITVTPYHAVEPTSLVSSNIREHDQINLSDVCNTQNENESYKDLEEPKITLTPNDVVEFSPLVSSNVGENNQINLSDVCNTQNENKTYKDLEAPNNTLTPNDVVKFSPLVNSNVGENNQINLSDISNTQNENETYKDIEEPNTTLTPNDVVKFSPLVSSNVEENNQINLSDVCNTQNENDMLECSNNMSEESYMDEDSLQYRKKWAFGLLARYACTVSGTLDNLDAITVDTATTLDTASTLDTAPTLDIAPTRRRRVRRRKRPAKVLEDVGSSPPATSVASAMDCDRAESNLPTDQGCVAKRSWRSYAPPVLRNHSAHRRGPRTVRSLSPQLRHAYAICSNLKY